MCNIRAAFYFFFAVTPCKIPEIFITKRTPDVSLQNSFVFCLKFAGAFFSVS